MSDSTADLAPLTPDARASAGTKVNCALGQKRTRGVLAASRVNVEHLMAYVDEQKAEGNAAFRQVPPEV